MSILNNKLVGINQILPHKNKWAWDLFLKGCSNHWMPTEISMKKDIEQWMDKDGFSGDERLVIKRCLGFFAGAESLVSNNLLLTVFKYVNDGECYSSDTQILTSDGWKYFYNLTDDDKVAEFDINTNEVEFIKPLNIIKKEYKGDMVQINNKLKHIDLLVTPNHELLLQNHKKEYIKINSDKKIPRNYKFIHGGKKNSGKNVLSFEERFMIALQADGSLKDERLKSKYKYITCEFSFTKDRKKRRFEYILNNTNFKYKKRNLKNNVVKYYVRCPKEFAKKYFNWVNIELVSSSWTSEFLEELGEWDADKNDKNTRLKYCNYYSKISENVDIIQALCSISGSYRSKRRLHVDNRKETFSDIHGIGFLKYDKYTCCQNLTQEKVAYNGMVYCVTVPKGNIIVRRNNSVVVCGNCRQYLFRQMMEESLHNLTVVYCCDSLRLNIKEVYEAYQNISAIKRKDDFLTELTKDSNKDDIDVDTIDGKKKILKNIITYYILCEGLLFYSGFALLLNFKRYDKLHGLAQQIAYTMRDENLHVEFGINLIKIILKEIEQEINNEDEIKKWRQEFRKSVTEWVKEVVDIEKEFIDEIIPNGILGLNKNLMHKYIEFLANIRLTDIGLKGIFKGANDHPLSWMCEVVEMRKQVNFFEDTVTEYKTAGAYIDDL